MKSRRIESNDNSYHTIFILDDETKFLSKNLETKEYRVISSSEELSGLLKEKFQVKNIVILVELEWDNPVSQFYGYGVAKELMNSPNRLTKFNLLFISTFSREILYKINKSSSRVFVKSFQHKSIDQSFSFKKSQVVPISEKKFDYLRRYCLTETGILEKLEHDLRPGKNLSGSQIEDLILQMNANADLLGLKITGVLNESNPSNFQSKRVLLYEHLVYRIKEVAKNKNLVSDAETNTSGCWKPLMLLIEDDDKQRAQMEIVFKPYFTVAPASNGDEALKYLKKNHEQISVVLCDMELLDKTYLEDDIQGIDIIEYIKENHFHIVLKVISHLPRRGLNMMLGDILKASDLLYKSMLLDGNADFISDLAREIQNEVDLRRTIQKLRGPSNTLWGNFSRQGGPGGKLKQFYYELRNNYPIEFTQMWEEVDIIIQGVVSGKDKIKSKFPTVEKRNEIAKMPLQNSIRHLKELLVNRLFWIRVLYSGSQEESVKFADYKKYFENGFLLFSTDNKRFSQYASLTGFSIRQSSIGEHIFVFNQFLEEEFSRVKAFDSDLVFDPTNSFLIDDIYDILEIIPKAGAKAFFTLTNYPNCKEFWDRDDKLPLVTKTLEQLTKEKSSDNLIPEPGGSRDKISALLSGLQTRKEYNTYPENIKRLIITALKNMNKS
jgi:CheY-like chemotaxis protein